MSSLLKLLQNYTPFDEHEAQMTAQLRAFLEGVASDAVFGRDLAGEAPNWGHVTGSAWIVNEDASRVIMLYHAKLNKWVQPGGHCDGESDVLSVAMREAREETGLEVAPVTAEIFDIDVHRIPEYWNTPEHFHYDVRFLLRADSKTSPVVSHESRAVRWVSLEEAAQLSASTSITRMIEKTRRL